VTILNGLAERFAGRFGPFTLSYDPQTAGEGGPWTLYLDADVDQKTGISGPTAEAALEAAARFFGEVRTATEGKAVRSRGNTGPRDFSGEVGSHFARPAPDANPDPEGGEQ